MTQNRSSAVMHQRTEAPEEWRTIPSFPAYEASSEGRIRRGSKIRNLSPNGDGYFRVNLSVDGKAFRRSVHALVCEAFHGRKPAWADLAAHGDGNRGRNHPSNLRWATYAQNSADMEEHGTRLRRSQHPRARLSESEVAEIRQLHAAAKGAQYARRGIRLELAAKFNVSLHIIKDIVGGRSWPIDQTIPLPATGDVPEAGEPSTLSASSAVSPANLAPVDPATVEGACGHAPPAFHSSSGDDLGIHQPGSIGQGRARDRAMCPIVSRCPSPAMASDVSEPPVLTALIRRCDEVDPVREAGLGGGSLDSATGQGSSPFGFDAGAGGPGREPIDIPNSLNPRAASETVVGNAVALEARETGAGPLQSGPASSFDDLDIPEFLDHKKWAAA